jgi:hypothetical protein
VTGITQSDRVAAGSLHPGIAKFYERGSHDHCKDVKTFASHRMEERARIVGIIQERIDIHSRFINFCMDNDVQVTPSIFSAIVELRALLRKIECRD